MDLKKWALTGMAVALFAAWASPVALAGDRDGDRFKEEVLRAVEKLMDRKLKDFKSDLMQDIKKMLQGRESKSRRPEVQEPQRRVVKPARAPKAQKEPQVKTERRVMVLEGPPGGGREEKNARRNVQVYRKDGKVHVRVDLDGKVMEKEFDLGDPEFEKWMKKQVPGGFRFEGPGGKGGFRVEVEKEDHGEKGEHSRGRGRGEGVRVLRGPGMEEAGKWLEVMKKRFGDRLRARNREGKSPWIELEKDFIAPFQKEFAKKAKPDESGRTYRALKARSDSELEKLRKEKEELKKELEELRGLLEELVGRMRRRR